MNLKSERHVNFAPEINPRLITPLSLSLSLSRLLLTFVV